MSTLKQNPPYSVPSSIYWQWNYNGSFTDTSMSTTSKLEVEPGTTLKGRILWYSPYNTYQVRWRSRKRLSLNNPAFVVGALSDDQWTEWSEYSGLVENTKSPTRVIYVGSGDVSSMSALDVEFPFPYDISLYDKIEYEFDVRAYNEPTMEHSEWGVKILQITYQPTLTLTDAKKTADGGAEIVYTTNWLRPFQSFWWSNTQNVLSSGVVRGTFPGTTGVFKIPNSSWLQRVNIGSNFVLKYPRGVTQDNVENDYISSVTLLMSGAGKGLEIVAPVLETIIDSDKKSISIVINNPSPVTSLYTAVTAALKFTDPNTGLVKTIDPLNILWMIMGERYIANFIAPPLDIPFTIDIGVSNAANGWETGTVSIESIPSEGMLFWTSYDGETYVALRMFAEYDEKFEVESESRKPAGRDRPISRYGIGGTNSLQASGRVRNEYAPSTIPTTDYTSLLDFVKLKQGTSWYYRTPFGGWYPVRITSSPKSYKQPSYLNEVSVSMEEVS